MNAWTIMGGAGKIKLPTSLPARFRVNKYIYSHTSGYFCPNVWIAFQDTFRGRVCECPVSEGVHFKGDGYNHCEGDFFPILIEL